MFYSRFPLLSPSLRCVMLVCPRCFGRRGLDNLLRLLSDSLCSLPVNLLFWIPIVTAAIATYNVRCHLYVIFVIVLRYVGTFKQTNRNRAVIHLSVYFCHLQVLRLELCNLYCYAVFVGGCWGGGTPVPRFTNFGFTNFPYNEMCKFVSVFQFTGFASAPTKNQLICYYYPLWSFILHTVWL
jgi:hypothetical protein